MDNKPMHVTESMIKAMDVAIKLDRQFAEEAREQRKIAHETVASIRDTGKLYIVVTGWLTGWLAFHPPLLVDYGGTILGEFPINTEEAHKAFYEAEIVYENTFLKEKSKHPDPL